MCVSLEDGRSERHVQEGHPTSAELCVSEVVSCLCLWYLWETC